MGRNERQPDRNQEENGAGKTVGARREVIERTTCCAPEGVRPSFLYGGERGSFAVLSRLRFPLGGSSSAEWGVGKCRRVCC